MNATLLRINPDRYASVHLEERMELCECLRVCVVRPHEADFISSCTLDAAKCCIGLGEHLVIRLFSMCNHFNSQ
jgi:hypothetical protein